MPAAMPRRCSPRVPPKVEVGQAMPPGTDSVAPLDAVQVENGRAEALAPVSPGDGVLPAGGDCLAAPPLRLAGERLRGTDLAAFAAAGVTRVTVRQPRLRVVPLRLNSMVGAAARLDRRRHRAPRRRGAAGRDRRSQRRHGGRQRRRLHCASAAPAAAAATPASPRSPATARSPCTASRSPPAKPPPSAFPAAGRCCCCRGGSMPRSAPGWWSGARCWPISPAPIRPRSTIWRRACRWRARSPRRWGWRKWCRCAASATRWSPSPTNICRFRRSPAPTAGFWCRRRAKAIPPARSVSVWPLP